MTEGHTIPYKATQGHTKAHESVKEISSPYSYIKTLHSFIKFFCNIFCSFTHIFFCEHFLLPFTHFFCKHFSFLFQHFFRKHFCSIWIFFCSWFHASKKKKSNNNNKASFRTIEHSSRSIKPFTHYALSFCLYKLVYQSVHLSCFPYYQFGNAVIAQSLKRHTAVLLI